MLNIVKLCNCVTNESFNNSLYVYWFTIISFLFHFGGEVFDSWPSVMVKLSLIKALMKLYGRCSEWPRALEVRMQKDHTKDSWLVTQRISHAQRKHIFYQLGFFWDKFGFGCPDVRGLFLHVARWSSSRYLCSEASQHSSSWQISRPSAPELGALVASVEWHVVLSLLEADGPGMVCWSLWHKEIHSVIATCFQRFPTGGNQWINKSKIKKSNDWNIQTFKKPSIFWWMAHWHTGSMQGSMANNTVAPQCRGDAPQTTETRRSFWQLRTSYAYHMHYSISKCVSKLWLCIQISVKETIRDWNKILAIWGLQLCYCILWLWPVASGSGPHGGLLIWSYLSPKWNE